MKKKKIIAIIILIVVCIIICLILVNWKLNTKKNVKPSPTVTPTFIPIRIPPDKLSEEEKVEYIMSDREKIKNISKNDDGTYRVDVVSKEESKHKSIYYVVDVKTGQVTAITGLKVELTE